MKISQKIGSILSSIILITSFISCSSNKNDQNIQESKDSDLSIINKSLNIELNKGKKWKVDENMIVYIRNMEQVINENNNNKDYSVIATSLQKNIDLLTSNCTMTGKAHDELHKWLLPYIELVDQLKTQEKLTKQIQLFEEIRLFFILFNQNFE